MAGTIMGRIAALSFALAISSSALAAPQEPVRNVLEASSHDWRQNITENEDYLSEERVRTIFSPAFAKSFAAASVLATADDSGIFEVDFLINSQTGCPFENVKLEEKPAANGVTLVDARFNAFRCLTDGEDTTRVSHLVFKVVRHDGHDVIDDILRIDDAGKDVSMRHEMDSYGR